MAEILIKLFTRPILIVLFLLMGYDGYQVATHETNTFFCFIGLVMMIFGTLCPMMLVVGLFRKQYISHVMGG